MKAAARAIAQHIQAFPYDDLPRDRKHARECERAGCTPAMETQDSLNDIAQTAITAWLSEPDEQRVERVAVAIVESTSGPWDCISGQGKDAARCEALAAIQAMAG